MFNYTLPNGVPVKSVLKAIVTGQPSHAQPSSQSLPTPASAYPPSPSQLDTSSAYDGIHPEDDADKIDPYKVYEHGESGTGGPGKGGNGRWDEDGEDGDWGKVMQAVDECFGQSS